MGIQVVPALLVTVSQYMNWCSFQWLKISKWISGVLRSVSGASVQAQICVFKLHPEEYEFGIISAHYSIIKTWSCFIKKRCDLWKSHAVIWLPCLDDRSLVRMWGMRRPVVWLWRGNQLALRLIKAISPAVWVLHTVFSTFRENWLECSLWAGSHRLHLQNHFPDSYSHFLWKPAQSSSRGDGR